MNSITIVGYIANLKQTEKTAENLRQITFDILDNYKSRNERKFNAFRCVYFTKSDKLFGWIQEKKAKKHQFTIVGELRQEVFNGKNYDNIIIKNLN